MEILFVNNNLSWSSSRSINGFVQRSGTLSQERKALLVLGANHAQLGNQVSRILTLLSTPKSKNFPLNLQSELPILAH